MLQALIGSVFTTSTDKQTCSDFDCYLIVPFTPNREEREVVKS